MYLLELSNNKLEKKLFKQYFNINLVNYTKHIPNDLNKFCQDYTIIRKFVFYLKKNSKNVMLIELLVIINIVMFYLVYCC